MSSPGRKEGFLKKQGHVRKNWKLRFFILEDWTLSYYESRQSSQASRRALGKLFLQGATVEVVEQPVRGVSNTFQVKTKFGNKKFLNIAATSAEDLKEWVDTIKANIDSSVGAGNVKFSKPLLDFGLKNQTVDLNTPIYDEFDIISLSTKKMKFRFEPLLTKSYDLTFEPAAGSVSKFGRVTVKAKMVVNNPEIINAKAPLRTGEAETTYLSFKCRGAGGAFGCDPTTLPCEWDNGYKVPSLLVQMKRSLLKNNAIAQEGIFRLAGDAYEIKRTKETMNKSTFDEDASEVNVVASLIKIWFRELPVPILNVISKEHLMNCGEKQACFDVYLTLPEPQKSLLDWLLDLLLEFSANSAVNKMSLQNIAIVVAPNLYDPPDGNPMEGLVLSQKCVQFFHNLMVYRNENPGGAITSSAAASGDGTGSGFGSKSRPQPRYSTPTKSGSQILQSNSAPTSPVTPSAHSFSASSSLSTQSRSSSNLSSVAAISSSRSGGLSSSSNLDNKSAAAAAADLRKIQSQRPPPPSSRPRTQPPNQGQLRSQGSESNIVTSTTTTTESASAPKPLTPSVVKARQKSVFVNNQSNSSPSPLPARTQTTTAATSYSYSTTTSSTPKPPAITTPSPSSPSVSFSTKPTTPAYQEPSYDYQNTNGYYEGEGPGEGEGDEGGYGEEAYYDNNNNNEAGGDYYNNQNYDESGYYQEEYYEGTGEYYE